MGLLLTLCVIMAVIGLILIILGVIPGAGDLVPGGYRPGIVLLVLGIILYVVLSLVLHPAVA
jgi:hypothetical protein